TSSLARRCKMPIARGSALPLWAGLAVASYAVHPLRVETVAWASGQPYLLSALLFVLAILAYLRACDTGAGLRNPWMIAAIALHGLSVFSKAMTVSLPAVLVIVDVYPLRRLGSGPDGWFGRPARRVWVEKAPFLGLSLIVSLAAFLSKV